MQVQESIEAICGEKGLADFLFGEIIENLNSTSEYEERDPTKLTDISSYENTIQAGNVLVSALKRLPYSYRVVMALPSDFSKAYGNLFTKYELASGIFILAGSELEENFPVKTSYDKRDDHLCAMAGVSEITQPKGRDLYLVQYLSRYVGQQKESPVVADFKTTARQFIGALLAAGVVAESN